MCIIVLDINNKKIVDKATKALSTDGICILKNVVDKTYLKTVKTKMDADSKKLIAYCNSIGGNPRRKGQLQQSLPPFPPYLHKSFLAHPIVWKIIYAVLGEKAGLIFLGGNTNCKGSEYQKVHLDQAHKKDSVNSISSLALNIAPQNISKENGSIEVWPGTHCIFSNQIVGKNALEARKKIVPPLQITAAAGDMIIRDPKLWHRGTHNPSDEFRHLIGAVVHRDPKMKVPFDVSAESFIENLNVNLNPIYQNLKKDYLIGPTKWIHEQKINTNQTTNSKIYKPLTDL